MEARPPVLEDAGAVTRCINALSMSDSGFADYRDVQLAEEWADADLSDILVVEDLGAIVGFLRFESDPPYFEAYVHPGSKFPLVFDLLMDRVEAWARGRVRDSGAPLTMETDVANELSRTILERRGFSHTGTSTHFVYDVTGAIPPLDPVVSVRAYVEGVDDELFYEVLAAGFGDDWDEPPSAEFIAAGRKRFGYSPDLWLLAEHEGKVVGALQGFEQWVGSTPRSTSSKRAGGPRSSWASRTRTPAAHADHPPPNVLLSHTRHVGTRQDWEDEAQNWLAWTRTPGHDRWFHEVNLPAFLGLLPPAPGRLLDVGCGEGRWARCSPRRGTRSLGSTAHPPS